MRTVAIHAPHTQDPPAHALAKGERDAASEGRHMNYETGPLPSKTGYSTVTGSSARAPPTAKGRHPVFGDCVRARGLPAVGDAVSARGVPVVSVTDTTVNTLECLVLATGRRACLHVQTHKLRTSPRSGPMPRSYASLLLLACGASAFSAKPLPMACMRPGAALTATRASATMLTMDETPTAASNIGLMLSGALLAAAARPPLSWPSS